MMKVLLAVCVTRPLAPPFASVRGVRYGTWRRRALTVSSEQFISQTNIRGDHHHGLVRLSVNHYKICEAVTLDFSPGFTVLTGESGAGKSLVLEALSQLVVPGYVSGQGRGRNVDVVRAPSAEAYIEAHFRLSDPQVLSDVRALLDTVPGSPLSSWSKAEAMCESSGPSGLDLILGRTIPAKSGAGAGRRNTFRVNGVKVSARVVESLGPLLVDFNGQYDAELLRAEGGGIGLLDQFCAQSNDGFREASARLRTALDRADTLRKEAIMLAGSDRAALTAALGGDIVPWREARAKWEESAQDLVEDVRKFHVKAGEEAMLGKRRAELVSQRRIAELVGEALAALNGSPEAGGRGGVLRGLMDAHKATEELGEAEEEAEEEEEEEDTAWIACGGWQICGPVGTQTCLHAL